MEIVVASKSGFCFGVRRAIKAAKEAEGNVFSLGDIIHNKQVVQDLEQRGVKRIENTDGLRKGDTVIVRSHGEPPAVFEELENKGVTIIDATCPYVKAAQNHGKHLQKKGYDVIILGTAGHPEVIGLAGYSGSNRIISDADEITGPLSDGKIAVLAQTTLPRNSFKIITEKIKKFHPDAVIIDTICEATKERQDAALNLAENVDVIVVVGGKHSSNTKKLAEICKKKVPTYLVEEPDDLDPSWFRKDAKVGITAGASTPESIIHDVVKRIGSFDKN